MWREIERKINLGKSDTSQVLRELGPGDNVYYGDIAAGVTVAIIDNDVARVYALQKQLMISAGELDGRTMERQVPIMPSTVERTIEKQSIYITGGSIRKHITVEWYPSNSSTQ
ncbi:MAG: hypothetical protein AAB702_02160 [Patescibacteria group bacterium]